MLACLLKDQEDADKKETRGRHTPTCLLAACCLLGGSEGWISSDMLGSDGY